MTVNSGGSSYSGTLYVDSNGDFTSSGFRGSTPSGSYTINVEGYFVGSTMYVTESASYDSGGGEIYGSGQGDLNADFPAATYASGSISGTISDGLGARSFTVTFTATRTSGGGNGGLRG